MKYLITNRNFAIKTQPDVAFTVTRNSKSIPMAQLAISQYHRDGIWHVRPVNRGGMELQAGFVIDHTAMLELAGQLNELLPPDPALLLALAVIAALTGIPEDEAGNIIDRFAAEAEDGTPLHTVLNACVDALATPPKGA